MSNFLKVLKMNAKSVYTIPNEVGSFSTLHGVLKNPKLKGAKKENVKMELQKIESFVQHTPIKKKFKKRRYMIHGFKELWSMDLAQLDRYARQNSNYKYILGVVEALSKKVFLRPIKKKNAQTVLNAFVDIVKEAGYFPRLISADKGSEFKSVFKKYLDDHNITIYHTYNLHSVFIERFWRTLKNRLETYFTYTGKKRWLEILPQMAHAYNETKHSSTKFIPNLVNKENELQVLHNLYDKYLAEPAKKSVYKAGDIVKVGRNKLLFEKSSTANFTSENFKISKVVNTNPITYKLVDLNNEAIGGNYYAQELAKVNLS